MEYKKIIPYMEFKSDIMPSGALIPDAQEYDNNGADGLYIKDISLSLIHISGVLSQKAKPLDVSLNEEVVSYLMDSGALNADALKSFMPSVCNRLDRNTSGLIVDGKSLLGLQQIDVYKRQR